MGFRARVLLRGDHVREWFLVGAPAAEVLEWQRDRAVLDGLFRRCPIGLAVHSPEMTIPGGNRAMERFTGIPARWPDHFEGRNRARVKNVASACSCSHQCTQADGCRRVREPGTVAATAAAAPRRPEALS